MTQNNYKKNLIQKRKDNNLCVLCGEPLDREGSNCTKCREKLNNEQRENREFYRRNNICPKCGKNKLYGTEKNCPECRAKTARYAYKIRENSREEYNEKQRVIHKNLYNKRKEQGICTRCGKREPQKGYFECAICRDKAKKLRELKRKGVARQERFSMGLCYFCGEPVKDGYKVCEKHYQINIQNLDNAKVKENRIILKHKWNFNKREEIKNE